MLFMEFHGCQSPQPAQALKFTKFQPTKCYTLAMFHRRCRCHRHRRHMVASTTTKKNQILHACASFVKLVSNTHRNQKNSVIRNGKSQIYCVLVNFVNQNACALSNLGMCACVVCVCAVCIYRKICWLITTRHDEFSII